MSLWEHRAQALTALETSLSTESSYLQETFESADLVVRALERAGAASPESGTMRTIGLLLLKCKYLAQCCYATVLDGFDQEGGAVFRVLWEAVETISYLYQHPEQIQQLTSGGGLPTAGERAKAINSEFQGMRDWLNEHASHVNLTEESRSHLEDREGHLQLDPPFSESELRQDMSNIFLAFMPGIIDAANYLHDNRPNDHEVGALAHKIGDLRIRGLAYFDVAAPIE